MDIQYFSLSRSGQQGSLTLRKVALFSLMFSTHFNGPLRGVSGDQGLIEEIVDGMEHALGIGSMTSSSSMSASRSMSASSTSTPASASKTASTSMSGSKSMSTSRSISASMSMSASTLTVASTSTSASSSTSGMSSVVNTTSASTKLLPSSVTALLPSTVLSTIASATASAIPVPQPVASNTTTSGNSTQPRAVFAHVIVGNTYNYTMSTWANDIALAASKGIDAFALNVGSDSWEPGQIANAYAAAGQYNAKLNNTAPTNATNTTTSANSPFKLFLSFDMSSLPCSAAADAQPLQTYIKTYANNTSQMTYNGRMLVSTFAGEACTFNSSSLNAGWVNALKPANSSLPGVWFVPSFFIDPQTFKNLTVVDGMFHWNSAWPMGNNNITFAPDASYIANLGNRTYMAAASPWFFAHYGPDTYNKNFIYRGDDWLFAQRWEMLVQNRSSVALAEVLTWNDFGESHYVGPVEGVQPMSQGWVNGYDHTGWLDLMKYYIAAYKTGTYPAIAKDRVFLWGRLAPANATAPADSVGKPTNWQWTQDYAWAVALLTAPANVTLSCGSTSQTTLVPAGLAKLKLKLNATCAVKAAVARGGNTTLSLAPAGFSFNMHPSSYNFNAFVAASPA
ncbi:Glucan endo-1,3-alpha-glucosidase agn1 [Trametes pubescens]|uniref:Glucan endo-1,3-alpha-glucosidase agn1 n=1 Tax=Trametes pubescens TaxID=154538 RepID=A0A1M2VTY0_TRAPU|nr:Glucan endo-1,3-alpha-glucosidase agn1 [Trametes pubescens]